MEAINITAHPKNQNQIDAVKAFMKALKIKFEITEKPYNLEFIAKIKESETDFEKGRFTTVNVETLNSYIDNL